MTDLTTAPTPLLLWYTALGILAGLCLALTGLLVVGNILCAVRASCGTREVGKRLNH